MRDMMYSLALVALITAFVFLILGLLKKPRAWRNAGIAAGAWLVLILLAPNSAQEDRASESQAVPEASGASQAETQSLPEDGVEDANAGSGGVADADGDGVVDAATAAASETDESSTNDGVTDLNAGSSGVADGDGVVDANTTPPSEADLADSAATSNDYTSPEVDPSLKRIRSNLLPVEFQNVRNVGGNTGDDLGAGLWMSADAEGYQCHETEAYSSPFLEGLKQDLRTGLESNSYAYEEIQTMGDETQGNLIVWKASRAGQVVIGFFATTGGAPGTMALCRATAL